MQEEVDLDTAILLAILLTTVDIMIHGITTEPITEGIMITIHHTDIAAGTTLHDIT